MSTSASTTAPPRDYFATTRWTMVIQAVRKESPQGAEALEELCRTYWYPLYAYIRQRGYSHQDAEDLVQGFLSQLLTRERLKSISAEQGKFRAFLLASLKNFIANEWDKAHAEKRGGKVSLLSIDWQNAETRYHLDPPDTLTPDKLYDRAWALTVLEKVIHRLRDEYLATEETTKLFEQLKHFLSLDKQQRSYAEAATALDMPEGTVRVIVHRMRRRYRELLEAEVAQTLSDPGRVKEELQALVEAFSG